jgi:LacI family transcriptional regulator
VEERENHVTIKDVAREANVSIATVSRIINGKDGVSPELEARVRTIIAQLHYKPNAMARALKVRATRSLGLIIPDIENPFFPAIVRGVEDAAKRYNYSVILCNSDGEIAEERKYVELLYEKRVDGIIFTGGKADADLACLTSLDIPVVVLDRRLPGMQISSVTSDNVIGGRLAVEHLLTKGRSKIVFISGPDQVVSSQERYVGYCQAVSSAGLDIQEEYRIFGDFSYQGGYDAVTSLMDRGSEIDGIFAANDLMAIGAIEALQDLGIHVPSQVSVIGFDDIQMASIYKPRLTTIRQPIYQMGAQAVRMIMKGIHSKRQKYDDYIYQPELVIRQST